MLDATIRSRLDPALDAVAGRLGRMPLRPGALTLAGLGLGLGAAAAAAGGAWLAALALWLTSRLADGLDGPLARVRGASELGGFWDIMADFTVYAAFIIGVAVEVPDARLAAVAVLAAYYLSGSALLAWSSLAERQRRAGDRRSLHFMGGIAEGTETILAYVVVCLFPGQVTEILWVWATLVGITAAQRVGFASRRLREGPGR